MDAGAASIDTSARPISTAPGVLDAAVRLIHAGTPSIDNTAPSIERVAGTIDIATRPIHAVVE
jgi:hypothetical protein